MTAAAVAAGAAAFPRARAALAGHRRRAAQSGIDGRCCASGWAARSRRSRRAGWDGDALEAQAFAYLAVRSLKGLPLSLPGTTGVKTPTTGGKLHRAAP